MRGIRWLALVVLLVGLVGTAALGARPVRTAHGEFWSVIYLGQTPRFDVQITFNIQARGEDDRGTISIRYFDVVTAKLVGVVVSTEIFPIWFESDEQIGFVAQLRAPKWDMPMQFPEWAGFLATDGGASDDFEVFGFYTFSLTPTRGKIVIHAFD